MSRPKNKDEYRAELADTFAHVLEEKGLEWQKEWRGSGGSAPQNGITKACYTGEKTEVPAMFFRKRDKVVLTLTPQEARYARSILLRWRNKLLNAGKPTEDVEELILRLER